MTLIGACLGSSDWQRWSSKQAEAELKRYRCYGVNAIFAEADHYSRDIIQIAHDNDLRFIGALSCFNNNDALARNPELRPICRDGPATSADELVYWHNAKLSNLCPVTARCSQKYSENLSVGWDLVGF